MARVWVRCWVMGMVAGMVGPVGAQMPERTHSSDTAATACRLKGLERSALCGSVSRALDPLQPRGQRVDIHFAVLPALARRKAADAVFFFAGGPGQSAIDLAGPLSRRFVRLSNRRDLVFVDQRGTGRSAPLKCADDDERKALQPLAEGVDERRRLRRVMECRLALQKLPHGDLRQYTSTIAMGDVDAVRASLGLAQINVVGASYGTRAVLEYQRQFPQRLRRVVIDGVAPPDMMLPVSFSTDNQAALDAVFVGCEREDACQRRYPDLRDRWRQLLASLPVSALLPHPMTGREERVTITRELVLGAVRSPLYAPALAAALPAAIAEAARQRFVPLLGLAGALSGSGGSLATGMHFSVVCSEDLPLMGRAVIEAPGKDFGTSFSALYAEVCADWPRGSVPGEFYRVGPSAAPVWVLSGGLDPATPPRHGERVARLLGARARHVVVPQAGHGVLSLACVRDAVVRFVSAESDDEALKLDAGCAASLPRPLAFQPLATVAQDSR